MIPELPFALGDESFHHEITGPNAIELLALQMILEYMWCGVGNSLKF